MAVPDTASSPSPPAGSPTDPPVDLATLVERQADACPDAVAVVDGTSSLSYRELDAAANRLARRLLDLGVGPEVLVGICVERSLDMTVGLLATLKAGGGCVPLDPSYPAERLGVMLADADPPVVLTQAGLVELVSSACTCLTTRIVDLDAERASLANRPAGRPDRVLPADRLAYVIYTSGSTGQPHGVMLGHQALVNHAWAAVDLYRLGPADRVVQFCSISFDVSIEELFPTWAAGGQVVLRPADVPILGRPWLDWLRTSGISVLNLPTAYWHEWVRDLQAHGEQLPPDLRVVIVGGERALAAAYRSWLGVGGDRISWFNAYGPSEASVMATVYQRQPGAGADPQQRDPPIGRPLPNVSVHLLDPDRRPVPDGEVGEIYIGGAGLARGYLNQPELTAERFVPDPFTDEPGARLYRTGDLGRLRADGELEFAGRQDRQVKVSGGFRVECGEVEVALRSHPAVVDAAVLPREDQAGQRRLVGYLVLAPESAVSTASLRGYLAGRLPTYMVPTSLVELTAFPLTPNGKVDHAVLAGISVDQPSAGRSRVAPRTPTEQALLGVWSEVLGIEELGVTDDLFDLGVHSLLATQLVVRVQEAFGTPLSLGTLLAVPSVAQLAARLEAEGARPQAQAPSLVAPPRPVDGLLPLSFPQEQMWTLENASGPAANENVTACHRFGSRVDRDVLQDVLRDLVVRHESLRTHFVVHEGRPYQRVAASVPVELGSTELAAPTEREAALQALIGEQDFARFELTAPPLFRAHLYRLDVDRSVLAITLDHLICDGPSAYILLSELAAGYAARTQGRAAELPPLSVRYADFALWQRRWLTQERLADQLEYWRHALADLPTGPALPLDRVPAAPTRRLRSLPVRLGPATYRSVAELARRSQASVFVVCLAAVSALLARQGGRTDVVVSTTLSGRQRVELEGVVGNFAGTGRLRTDVSGDPSFTEVVARARQAVIGLFEHQDIPFFWVREAVIPTLARSGADGPPLALLPVEFQYFRAAHDHWVPGSGVLERPGPDKGPDELFFRGQLHPLSITLLDDGAQLWGEVTYKLDFYDEATIARLAEGLVALVEAVVADPGQRVSELPAG